MVNSNLNTSLIVYKPLVVNKQRYFNFSISIESFFKAIFSFFFLLLFFLHLWFFLNVESVYNFLISDLPLSSLGEFIKSYKIYPGECLNYPPGISEFKYRVVGHTDRSFTCSGFTLVFIKNYYLFLVFTCFVFQFASFSSGFYCIICVFFYVLSSCLFYHFLFFYFFDFFFDVHFDPLLEFPKDLFVSPLYDLKLNNPVNLSKISTILLNYCVLLDLDISFLVSDELFDLKVRILSRCGVTKNVVLANSLLKMFFVKWSFALGRDANSFFMDFYDDI